MIKNYNKKKRNERGSEAKVKGHGYIGAATHACTAAVLLLQQFVVESVSRSCSPAKLLQ